MTGVSMSAIWEETVAFVTREKALVLPVGFATFGIGLLLCMMFVPQSANGQIAPGPWMLCMPPAYLLATIGYLTLSAITLTPGVSVAEAIRTALGRLPMAVALTVLLFLAMAGVLVISGVALGVVGATIGWGVEQSAVASVMLAALPLGWASIRLTALWPLLVDRGLGPVTTITAAFRLTAGHALPIAGVIAVAALAYFFLTAVAQLAGGSLLLLLGRALGAPAAGMMLANILVSGVAAGLATVWAVFVALLYRRLSGSTNGSGSSTGM